MTSTERVQEWRKKNKKYYLKAIKDYANKNPGYNVRIDIGVKEYRKAVLAYPANGTCQICGRKPRREHLCLDHCHSKKKFRGWICRQCNTGLGQFQDNLYLMKKAISYLRRKLK